MTISSTPAKTEDVSDNNVCDGDCIFREEECDCLLGLYHKYNLNEIELMENEERMKLQPMSAVLEEERMKLREEKSKLIKAMGWDTGHSEEAVRKQ